MYFICEKATDCSSKCQRRTFEEQRTKTKLDPRSSSSSLLARFVYLCPSFPFFVFDPMFLLFHPFSFSYLCISTGNKETSFAEHSLTGLNHHGFRHPSRSTTLLRCSQSILSLTLEPNLPTLCVSQCHQFISFTSMSHSRLHFPSFSSLDPFFHAFVLPSPPS